MRYICEWEREDSPTRGMTEKELRAYYKENSVRGDCRFTLRSDNPIPADMRAAWEALLERCTLQGKETPADREAVSRLRMAWRAWVDGRAYTLPEIVTAKPKRAARVACCPNCGHRMAA